MRTLCGFALLIVTSTMAFSNPSPLGITINKTTLSDISQHYQTTFFNRSPLNMDVYEVDNKAFNFNGLKRILITVAKDNRVKQVYMILDKRRFNDLYQGLKSKYQLLEENFPKEGTKTALFVNDHTRIMIESGHASFDMMLTYMDEYSFTRARQLIQKQNQQKPLAEFDQI